MIISAVVERIENGNAVLLSQDSVMEIRIPVKKGDLKLGDVLSVNINNGIIEVHKEVR